MHHCSIIPWYSQLCWFHFVLAVKQCKVEWSRTTQLWFRDIIPSVRWSSLDSSFLLVWIISVTLKWDPHGHLKCHKHSPLYTAHELECHLYTYFEFSFKLLFRAIIWITFIFRRGFCIISDECIYLCYFVFAFF